MASAEEVLNKGTGMLGMCNKATISGQVWPQILISTGNEVVQMLEKMSRTPAWLVVDGGALHARSAVAIRARNYKKWGSRGAVSVWGIHVSRDAALRRYCSVPAMAAVLDKQVQHQLAKAYSAVGGARFKEGIRDSDFCTTRIMEAMAGVPAEVWGENLGPRTGCSKECGTGPMSRAQDMEATNSMSEAEVSQGSN